MSNGFGALWGGEDGNAVVQPQGAAPLSGDLRLSDGLRVSYHEIEAIICFVQGTLIRTPAGERRIESLRPGDEVITRDNGPQKIRWIGNRQVRASGALAPVRVLRGVFGNHRDLWVSPQHRMLVTGAEARSLFGQDEVLVPAKSLVNDFTITTEFGGMVTYLHMLFDRHEVVIANGAPSESFYPGDAALSALAAPARDELFRLFPALRSGTYGSTGRPVVAEDAARALATL
ncbi:MAG: Hint domain-containing protein [Silicimonas sp.]|nr:Hint domain-containing protein [Silicimonas sp.]